MTDSLLDSLRAAVPDLRLKTDAGDLEHYGRDWTRRWTPNPLAIALPGSVEEVQAVMHWAAQRQVRVVPSGGRTGLSGGAVAADGELVLSLERMNKALAFDRVDRTLTVQAGMPLEAVHNAAREHGLEYPVDFAARGSCSIGGNIATNAGGIRVIRYGNTREWIAGLKVVTAQGELLDLNRALVKNSSGYDLRQLMIGSEGTLGIVVEATLRLADPPPPTNVMLLALTSFEGLMEVFAAFRERLRLEAFEFFTDIALRHVLAHGAVKPFDEVYPYYVVTEFAVGDEDSEAAAMAAFEACMEAGWVADGVISQSDAQAQQLWRLREGITESLAPYVPYKNDVSVRISQMPAFLEQTQALLGQAYPHFEVVWFGHIGDGNLHINVLKPEQMAQADFVRDCEQVTKLLAQALKAHGGSISAEHGIGLVKKPYLDSTRGPAEIALMRGIRKALDPQGLLNPGKLFDP
ncbi:FAD-binding oxidoreductase [Pseudoxanthomonas winnipegensis]|uniref:FAD-binding oxidoreductase n=1 Tax=Pseudoxanthomonas winnipegensis TaxID=2480810 RepID=A0A4Q8LFR6_9GAMM|nr:FAD-binding oxidoreductase [Pseudoxanthomonas winnipegensis]RZZ81846.1 FAD-binding oxidoreductase [Pseudoxanthomonas winnipegensis]TAA27834.1 FAD-binding oxidoreductase [Pseudoxanthomonas winnipegensis]TAA42285.1 FAD-binding oxidoreductase [Pseudoxanthomonas winnipegensis]TBV70983.1 FAD-binding oxidoreductase [Pseudoxanthomonas winnipegensis]